MLELLLDLELSFTFCLGMQSHRVRQSAVGYSSFESVLMDVRLLYKHLLRMVMLFIIVSLLLGGIIRLLQLKNAAASATQESPSHVESSSPLVDSVVHETSQQFNVDGFLYDYE